MNIITDYVGNCKQKREETGLIIFENPLSAKENCQISLFFLLLDSIIYAEFLRDLLLQLALTLFCLFEAYICVQSVPHKPTKPMLES